MKRINQKDLKIIEKQIGRYPDNITGIARRCPFDKPMIIVTAPYSQKGVFPTTYWLSCPYYVKEISKLEDKGLIGELTDKLNNDPQFRSKLKEAHKNYARQRISYLSEKQERKLKKQSPEIFKVIKESGVGGIIKKKGIKCLHTHLADYLINGKNPAGKKVYNLLPELSTCKNICDYEELVK